MNKKALAVPLIFTIAALTVTAILLAPVGARAEIIPADRLITWQGNVGVENGIPNRTTQVDCTAAPYNARADGFNTASNIQSCLNGIAAGQVAYLTAGTYTLT